MKVRFSYVSGAAPLDFEVKPGGAEHSFETGLIRHPRARNGDGDLTGGGAASVSYSSVAEGVAAVDIDDDEAVTITNYITRPNGPAEAFAGPYTSRVSLDGVAAVEVVA